VSSLFLLFLFAMRTYICYPINRFLSFLLVSIALFACNPETQISTTTGPQIKLSPTIETLLKDTTFVSHIVDSLKTAFYSKNDSDQIFILGELSENWRPHSFKLASEMLDQSKKLNFSYGEALSYCKFGIHYYRSYNIDSANFFLNKAKDMAIQNNWDKITVQAMGWSGEVLRRVGEKDLAIETHNKAISLALKINDKKGAAFCYMSQGEAYREQFQFEKAFECYNKCIAISEQLYDTYKIIICYNAIGDINRVKGNYVKSLEYFNNSIELSRKTNNKRPLAYALNSIGDVYFTQKEFQKALNYFQEAIKIAMEIEDKLRVGNIYKSMGMVYQQMKNTDMAFECYNRSFRIAEEIGNKDNMASSYEGMGDLYFNNKDYKKALDFYEKALNISTENGNAGLICGISFRIGECYYELKDFAKAKAYTKESFAIAKEAGLPGLVKSAAFILYKINSDENKPAEALKMLSVYINMKDSLSNEEQVKQFADVEYKAKEAGLKAEQIAREQANKAIQAQKDEELKRQKTIRYAFTIGFALVLVLVVVVFRNLQQNKKKNRIITAQKKEVEKQKELVEEKNKEITDSITYAKRLQEAILPPVKMVRDVFPQSFVLYIPKDIIAGDFYWMEHLDDHTFFAAADSTGHGVPGAMVSVVCSNALNRAVKEFKLKEPGKVLDKARELVLETFAKSEGDVKDGMDISLLCMDRKNKVLTWAGANNPLWYIDPENETELLEIKPDKQPIGKTDNPKPFTTHTLPYHEGKLIYLITDGYADQFGGPKGKKFKYKQLEDLLLSNKDKAIDEQLDILKSTFIKWRDVYEQVDDVTIVGIRI
jgi:tetratricopeptide (TPR) repeat protein